MPLYLGQDDAGTSRFSLQDFEPSWASKMNATVSEAWMESYGPVGMANIRARIASSDGPKLSSGEAAEITKQSGVNLKGLSLADGVFTRKQLDVLIDRQRELQAVKDIRERTPWDLSSPLRGLAMFGAGIADPINLATAFIPWTKSLTIMNSMRVAAASTSALTRFGGRAALGAADAGISTAVLEPLYAYGRTELGDDYGALDSMANIAFGTAFGGGIHAIGGVGVDAFRAWRGRATPAPMASPQVLADALAMTPEQRAAAGVAPESAIAGMPEIVEARVVPEPAVAAGPNTAPELPQVRRDLLVSLKRNGGISPDLARDAGGENGMRLNRKLPGVVSRNSRLTEYDQIAEVLAEEGFLPPGIESGSDEAIRLTQDLVTRAFNGERVLRWEDQIAEADAAQRRAADEAIADADEAAREERLEREAIQWAETPEARALIALQNEQASAAVIADSLSPETRENLLHASVAQSLAGRNVDVDAIAGVDPVLGTATQADVVQATGRAYDAQNSSAADFEAAAAVEQRVGSAPKWDTLADAEAAMGDADAALSDTVKAGDQAFKYARGQVGTDALQTVDDLTEALRQSFGESSAALMDAGNVKLVATPDDLPGGPHPADVKGATAPDGTAYIVAQNVSPAEARGMLLHEVGVHAGMQEMLGPQVFNDVLAELDDAIMRGEAWAQSARAAVPADTPAGLVREEQLAYLVQNAPELPIVQRILAAVRAWAYRTFAAARERMTLTEADFQAMAVAALHSVARNSGVGQGGLAPAFSRDVPQTDTKAFRDWFGESKVVDAEGRPLVVYHGTTASDKILQGGFKKGWVHLTDSKEVADSYQEWDRGGSADTIALYVKAENPAYYDAKGQKYTDIGNKVFRATWDAEKAGHDALIIKNIRDNFDSSVPTEPHTTVVAFEPTQIKSATGNRGTFDPANPDIRYSRGETPDPSTASDELKPYDDRIARVKSYAQVLRSAADKLENDAQATAAMRAAMPDITTAEINELLGQLRQQIKGMRGMARSMRDAVTADDRAAGMQFDAMQAADTLANNLHMAAVIEKRNAALNINARLRSVTFVNQYRNIGDGFEGFRALLVGSERKRAGGRLSVDAEQKQFRGEWIGGMIADLEQTGLIADFTSGNFDREIYQALWNLGQDGKGNEALPKNAVQIAEVINKYQSDARNTRNRFGAWIRDLQGYITRQTHDMLKIRDAGEQAWVDTVLPLLDIPKMTRLGLISEFDPVGSLRRIYDDFAAGNHMKAKAGEDDMAAFGSGTNLAKRESVSRALYFKDGNAAFDYNQRFGQGKLAETVLTGLEQSARSAGLLKVLGTNPEATLQRLFDEYQMSLAGDPAKRAKFNQRRGEMENLLAQLDGSVNIPGNLTAAKVGSFLRSWMTMAKLGGMLLSSVTDLSNYAAELRFGQDKNLLTGVLAGVGTLTQGRAKGEKKAILSSLGVFHESTLGAVYNRFDSPDMVGGKMAAAMQQFFKLSGINWWTESLRDGYALTHSHYLAQNARHAWDKLPDALRDMLGLYNIDAGKWEILRAAPLQAADGRQYMTPGGLKTVPVKMLEQYIASVGRTVSDASILNLQDDLSAALRTMTIDRMNHAVLEPGARTRAFMLRGTQPGTVPGELLRYITQFKSFPVAMVQVVLGREVYGRGYDTLGEYMRKGRGDMLGLATFIGLSTMMGYAAMSAKDLLRGKNPRPMDDPRTWGAAFIQGGGLGLYGDFLFGKYNRMGGTLTASMAGPTAGLFDTAADLWTRIRTGDDVAATAFNALLQNTPFMSLFYVRSALDYLVLYQMQEALNPGFLRRMERRIERENGQTFYLPPSQVAR